MFAGQIRQMGLSRIPQVSQDPVYHHFRIKMAIWGLYRSTLFQTRPEQLSKSASDMEGPSTSRAIAARLRTFTLTIRLSIATSAGLCRGLFGKCH